MISAEIVCDSISEQGKRLTTFKLRYPKFIHGEFMTHRVISRNASSSRAIPTAKLLEEVRSDALRAAPVWWGKNQAGMQAAEELDDTIKWKQGWINTAKARAMQIWQNAALEAVRSAGQMLEVGVHKQIVNRLLEPFSHINVVATATEWDNFFGLRLHKDAQPEMRALAEAMWEARVASAPTLLKSGDWHLPFVFEDDDMNGEDDLAQANEAPLFDVYYSRAVKVSVARCARVSYESFETGKRSTIEEDLQLYDRLTTGLRNPSQPLHASPMEHQATPDASMEPDHDWPDVYGTRWHDPELHGNFVGWCQYRKMLSGEAVAPLPEKYLPF